MWPWWIKNVGLSNLSNYSDNIWWSEQITNPELLQQRKETMIMLQWPNSLFFANNFQTDRLLTHFICFCSPQIHYFISTANSNSLINFNELILPFKLNSIPSLYENSGQEYHGWCASDHLAVKHKWMWQQRHGVRHPHFADMFFLVLVICRTVQAPACNSYNSLKGPRAVYQGGKVGHPLLYSTISTTTNSLCIGWLMMESRLKKLSL